MLFSEVYGVYYRIIGEILSRATEGTLTREEMYRIIREQGFEETALTIPGNLADQTWPLLYSDLTTPLTHKPSMPLTTLEKRWMKNILSDPRIRLFDPPAEGLEDVEPLYPPEAVVYYDRYLDGDPYEDPDYIRNFRQILTGLREKRWMEIRFQGRTGGIHTRWCIPYRLEYSPKDDKFRLIVGHRRGMMTLNLGRIQECILLQTCNEVQYHPQNPERETLVLELTDQRNALERCMHHFSHLEKETERLTENRYRLTLRYEKPDETEILIRVLSFGPMVRVISPDHFREKLRERIERQIKMRTWE